MPIVCGAPQEVRAQGVAASNGAAKSTSSADTTHSASILPGTDSLDSCEEESGCSTAATDTVSVSVSKSASEGSVANGGCSAYVISRLAWRRELFVQFEEVAWASCRPNLMSGCPTGAGGGGHVSSAVDASKGGGCNEWTGGIAEQLLASMHSVASPNLGMLLIGFLHIFGWAIDFTQVRLVTKVYSRSVSPGVRAWDLFTMGWIRFVFQCRMLSPWGCSDDCCFGGFVL